MSLIKGGTSSEILRDAARVVESGTGARAIAITTAASDGSETGLTVTSETGMIKVFYVEGTGNTTYTQAVHWANEEPRYFGIYNTGVAPLTIEINEGSTPDTYTVNNGEALGDIGYEDVISKVEILATSTFRLILKK